MPSLLSSYKSLPDLQAKVTQGICWYRDQLVHVPFFDGTRIILSDPMNVNKVIATLEVDTARIEDFNFTNFNLGLCKVGDEVVHMTRPTAQQQQQTLNSRNINVNRPYWTPSTIGHNYFEESLREGSFLAMLRNQYPTIQEAWNDVAVWKKPERNLARCFHKEFFFHRSSLNSVTLYYKRDPVGEITISRLSPKTINSVQLYPCFEHLSRKITCMCHLTVED